jgi:hypothetical protein
MKIIKGISWDEYITDNRIVMKILLDRKTKSSDTYQIMAIKNQINFIHDLLLMKDKLKTYVESRDDLNASLY